MLDIALLDWLDSTTKLSVRARTLIYRSNLSLQELREISASDLLEQRNLGLKSLAEIFNALDRVVPTEYLV